MHGEIHPLKRRAGPLRLLWSLEAYLSNAAGEDDSGQGLKTKTETLQASMLPSTTRFLASLSTWEPFNVAFDAYYALTRQ